MKSLWDTLFTIDDDVVMELKEIMEHMRSVSKEDRKLIGKPLKK